MTKPPKTKAGRSKPQERKNPAGDARAALALYLAQLLEGLRRLDQRTLLAVAAAVALLLLFVASSLAFQAITGARPTPAVSLAAATGTPAAPVGQIPTATSADTPPPATPTGLPTYTHTPAPTNTPPSTATVAPTSTLTIIPYMPLYTAFECPEQPVDGAASAAGGFMDFPVPYDGGNENFGGTLDQFRQASNREDVGGRISSFFDHEYPVFPWTLFGIQFRGDEPPDRPAGNSVLIFDGIRLDQDWYTGHTGYDIIPLPSFTQNTPVFAAADGILTAAEITPTGNHQIKINHVVPDGIYQTVYMHLQEDQYWNASRQRAGQPVKAGTRIGTMGTTGNSTGIHLHFEVYFDASGKGEFNNYNRVDPYGFIAVDAQDPWDTDEMLVTADGRQLKHQGVVSRYLWRQRLGIKATVGSAAGKVVAQEGQAQGKLAACVAADTLPPGAALLVDWSPDTPPTSTLMGTGNSYVISAQDAQGKPVQTFGAPITLSLQYTTSDVANIAADISELSPGLFRSVQYSPNDMADIDRLSLGVFRFDVGAQAWRPIPSSVDFERHIATGLFSQPGKYALMGRPVRDILPPKTTITLLGNQVQPGFYVGDIMVQLDSVDVGPSDVTAISYTLDFGDTWLPYTGPFTIRAGDPAPPRPPSEPEEALAVVSGEYAILARAVDQAGNLEKRPAVAGFSFVPAGFTGSSPLRSTFTPLSTATPTATDTPAPTPIPTATATATELPTATATLTPPPTATSTSTVVPTATPAPSNTATLVPTPTGTSTTRPTATATLTPTATSIPFPTSTPFPTAYPAPVG